jgi:hypothetical protein
MNLQIENLKFWLGRPQKPRQDVKLKVIYRSLMALFTAAVIWVLLTSTSYGSSCGWVWRVWRLVWCCR